MILLDTQVWVWWTEGGEKLSERHRQIIDTGEAEGIAACAFSVWEVAMLVSKKRLSCGSRFSSGLTELCGSRRYISSLRVHKSCSIQRDCRVVSIRTLQIASS